MISVMILNLCFVVFFESVKLYMQALNYQFTDIYQVFIYVWNGYFSKTLLSFVNKLHTSFSNPSLKQIFLK